MKPVFDILDEKERTETKQCESCGTSFQRTGTPVALRMFHYCSECDEKRKRQQQEENRARELASLNHNWKLICPPIFRETDPRRLPRPKILDEILKWKFGPKGLLIHGPTSLGKSRMAWQLLRREHLEEGRQIIALDLLDLGLELSATLGRSPDYAAELVRGYCRAQILFLDDPFKARLTDRVEEILFAIITRRTDHMKPIICTLNDTGETLLSRLSEDRGAPMIRRLREFSTEVKVT